MSVQGAIDHWHKLLAADPLGTWEQVQAAMQADRLYFGTRPVCSVLRPHFLSPRAYSYLVEVCLLYTSPSPRDRTRSRMPSSA